MSPEKQGLGILGGGQLARMLVQAAGRLGLGEVAILDETAVGAAHPGPANLAGGKLETGLATFFGRVGTVIFENEFVDCDRLEPYAAAGVRFFPALSVIRKFQDKHAQKCALHELGLPTSPFEAVGDSQDQDGRWIDLLLRDRFPRGLVLKWARLGYDGKGVCVVPPGDVPARERARRFSEAARSRGVGLFAEDWVDFRRELAVVACRSTTGEFAAYPLVESQQRAGICLRVQGPIADQALEHHAHDLARRFSEGAKIVGTFALEFFETQDGRLLINEIAPRVHNTGHYTQDAAATSQFENHWRAVLGQSLGAVTTSASFAMRNLLGPPDLELELAPDWMPEIRPENRLDAKSANQSGKWDETGIFPHWYGKTAVRAGRKLGHVNARSDRVGEAPALLAKLEEWNATWENVLRSRLGRGREVK